jgi:hypothetical protein
MSSPGSRTPGIQPRLVRAGPRNYTGAVNPTRSNIPQVQTVVNAPVQGVLVATSDGV